MALFIAADETGQLKIPKPADRNNLESESGKQGFLKASTANGELSRDASISSLGWTTVPSTIGCDVCYDIASSLVPTSRRNLIVGRKSGHVECIIVPEDFKAMRPQRARRFKLPGSVILATACSGNRVVALSRSGQGVIVNFEDENLWESSESSEAEPRLINSGFQAIDCGRKVTGRQNRSDGFSPNEVQSASQADHTNNEPSTLMADGCSDKPSWLLNSFSLPGPVDVAEVSSVDPSKLLIGGSQNLCKVIDLNSLTCVFSAKNSHVDCVGLEPKVDVTAIGFMDRLSSGSTCFAVGNGSGRVYIYDSRIGGKPVLDFQACPMGTSVAALAPSASLLYSRQHCCDSPTECSYEEGCCCHWKLKKGEHKSKGERQSLAVADNVGRVYLFDIRYGTECNLSTKKREYNPDKIAFFEQGEIVNSLPETSPMKFEADWLYNLKTASGGISDLQWSQWENQKSKLLAVGVSRYVNIWEPADKAQAEKIYMKNKLTKCLWWSIGTTTGVEA